MKKIWSKLLWISFDGDKEIKLEFDENTLNIINNLDDLTKNKIKTKIPKIAKKFGDENIKIGDNKMSDQQFKALSKMITDLKFEMNSKMDKIEDDIVEMKADIAELKADVAELKADMEELKNDMVIVKKAIIKLNKKVFGIEELIV
ncbi:hypothetical protein [[Acholeplasma] multilocale]|uniref:hypothetical protein n=1 Tax=[Acholeplasma] multilocale TaxID=264638 RepID=UPI00047D8C35|nr:hypothetical protein [[Acholeplasma] multilocale]